MTRYVDPGLRQPEAKWTKILEAITCIGREIATAQELERVLHLIMDKAAETVPMDVGLLFLVDEEAQMHRVAVAHQLPPAYVKSITFAFEEGVPGWVVKRRQALVVPDATVDPRVHPHVIAMGVQSVMAVPLIAQERVVGVLNFFSKTRKNAFDAEDLRLAQLYADQAAVFIENARLVDALRRSTLELEARVEERTRELRETQAQMIHTEKLAAVGRLAVSLAHEINNPLQAVALHLALVEEVACQTLQGESCTEIGTEIGIVQQELARIAAIVHQLLDVQRPRQDQRSWQDIELLLTHVLTLVDTQLRRTQIQVLRQQDRPLPQVWADGDQLKQVFLNLILNAADAMAADGELCITTAVSDHEVTVSVADNGPGIPAHMLHQIFEPFVSTKPSGTGLGLYVSYEIVAAHQGKLEVQSQPGEGATFVIRLPRSKANR